MAHKTKECRKAVDAYKQGVRVLQPNQFVANELTANQIHNLIDVIYDNRKPAKHKINAVIAEMKKVQP